MMTPLAMSASTLDTNTDPSPSHDRLATAAYEKGDSDMQRRLRIVVLAVTLVPFAAIAQPPLPEIILENPSVRITIVTYPPGTGTGPHQGIEAEVGIVVEGEIVLESPSGRTVLRPGTAYWLPGLTPHDTRNTTSRPAKMVDILLKRCD
jgi:mannose-6-phosphate isomerase-like protein (cupin superfamily)